MSEAMKKGLMEDPEDLELQAMMGSKFQDLSKAEKVAEVSKAPAEKKTCKKVMDATWEPVRGVPTDIERVKDCAKQAALYGSISMLLFYWQQAGLLASEAAVPSMIICALLAGLQIGTRAARG